MIARPFLTFFGGTVRPRTPRPAQFGQMYPGPVGDLKQPTDSGNMSFGSQTTTPGKKIVNAIVPKKI